MMYRIIGTDRISGYSINYGEFNDPKRCLRHMRRLITAFGLKILFTCKEVDNP